MDNKSETIKKIYYNDDTGYGSIAKTLKDAKQLDNTITRKDVVKWFDNHIGSKPHFNGYNSFVVDGAYIEYQIDLFFFADLEKESQKKQPIGLLAVDIFSKYVAVVPIKSKTPDDILNGLKEVMKQMTSRPETIFTDEEGAFVSNVVQKYFKDENINHIITRSHSAFAERAIRTIKTMIYRRTNGVDKPVWTDYLKTVLHVYNHQMIHSATGFTPSDGRIAKFRETIKQRLELKAKYNRKYPHIKVGDKVKAFRKKTIMDKERVLNFTAELHTVESIEEVDDQKLYKLSDINKPFIRSELYLIDTS